MKFRKRPIEIDAVQFSGENYEEIQSVFSGKKAGCPIGMTADGNLQIWTREGLFRAVKGDWVIRGIKGEVYPCKPDIFEATYEKVDE